MGTSLIGACPFYEVNMFVFEAFGKSSEDASYYVYVRRDLDDFYWDKENEEFRSYSTLIDGKIALTESEEHEGQWRADIDIGEYSGYITAIPREVGTDELLYTAVKHLYVEDGSVSYSASESTVPLHEHYGGMYNLRLIDDKGGGISGANISVYRKQDYESPQKGPRLGISYTDDQGLWTVPVFVPIGDTYTIVYHKEGVIEAQEVNVKIP